MRRAIGVIRLAHPFPSLLNALATLVIATLAGAPPLAAGRLALAMLSAQVSIGALNDLVDAPRDAIEKPGKPIPAGLATARDARRLAALAGGLAIVLSAPSGIPTAVVAGIGLLLGYLYDLRLSRTPWSWLPLAFALPLAPVHAWLGATGELPAGMWTLYPVAVVAGAALSVANGLVDLERDARSSRPTIAVTLGAGRAWLANVTLLAALAAAAVSLAPVVGAGDGGEPVGVDILRGLRTWGVALGIVALGLGAVALRLTAPALRERGWELEAVGIGAVGIGWLAGLAAAVPGGA